MRNNGRLIPDEVTRVEEKVLEKFYVDKEELKRMLLAKWLLNEGRQRLPQVETLPAGNELKIFSNSYDSFRSKNFFLFLKFRSFDLYQPVGHLRISFVGHLRYLASSCGGEIT